MPLSKEETIPMAMDWVITMVEPVDKLKEMYVQDVVNYGNETSKTDGSDERSDSNNSN